MIDEYKRGQEETEEEFCARIFRLKFIDGLTWRNVADIINSELNKNLSGDAYRKREKAMRDRPVDEYNQLSWDLSTPNEQIAEIDNYEYELDKIIEERQKIKDERVQINSILRRITRENTLKEMVVDAVSLMNDKFKLEPVYSDIMYMSESSKQAILQLSDLHYGIEINNYWNKYNPEICKHRLSVLRDRIIEKCAKENISKLYVINLGDLIAGRIHTPLRINSRMDVVSQTQQISELIAQLLADLSTYIDVIEYYDCLDNHSRVEPIKENSLNLESLARFTAWYLKERLKQFKSIHINDVNEFAPDIINFEVLGHKVIAVHGDKDKPHKAIQNLSLMTHQHYDLVLTSHRHHFSADEVNQTLLLSNGSMMGTDEFAEQLRLTADPSQNLIVVTEDSVMDVLYRIVLN